MMHPRIATIAVLVVGMTAMVAGDPMVQDDLTLPMRFRSSVMILNEHPPGTVTYEFGGNAGIATSGGAVLTQVPPVVGAFPPARGAWSKDNSARLTITIDRWTTEEEQTSLVQTLKSGGVYALVSAMENATVGHLQVNADLRLPIRWASTWMTDKGRVVRLATNGSILYPRSASRTLGKEYPIGIVEFTVPPAGRGEGTLVDATRADFDDRGRIMAVSLAMNTGTQRLTNVEREEIAGRAEVISEGRSPAR